MENIEQNTIITLESLIINSNECEDALSNYCNLYSHLERLLFNTLRNTENPKELYNTLQKQFIKDYNIHARTFKTLWKQTVGK